jgi:hypothetical protein
VRQGAACVLWHAVLGLVCVAVLHSSRSVGLHLLLQHHVADMSVDACGCSYDNSTAVYETLTVCSPRGCDRPGAVLFWMCDF